MESIQAQTEPIDEQEHLPWVVMYTKGLHRVKPKEYKKSKFIYCKFFYYLDLVAYQPEITKENVFFYTLV